VQVELFLDTSLDCGLPPKEHRPSQHGQRGSETTPSSQDTSSGSSHPPPLLPLRVHLAGCTRAECLCGGRVVHRERRVVAYSPPRPCGLISHLCSSRSACKRTWTPGAEPGWPPSESAQVADEHPALQTLSPAASRISPPPNPTLHALRVPGSAASSPRRGEHSAGMCVRAAPSWSAGQFRKGVKVAAQARPGPSPRP